MQNSELTKRQIELIEQSFAAVAPRGEALAARFYDRLFADFPDVKPLFRSEQKTQQKKLLASLVLVVNNLRNPEKLEEPLEQMGQRHLDYGVQDEQYGAVGATLLATLAEFAGSLWNAELAKAWTAAYTLISQRMIQSAAGASV